MYQRTLTCERVRDGRPFSTTFQLCYLDRHPSLGLAELAILSDWQPRLKRYRLLDSFTVEEIPTGLDGRAFLLHRSDLAIAADAEAGIDPIDERYGVLVARNGQDNHCECRGFQANCYCKHLDAMRHLVEGGLIDDPRLDPRPEPEWTEQDWAELARPFDDLERIAAADVANQPQAVMADSPF